jgi:hypothetical protein
VPEPVVEHEVKIAVVLGESPGDGSYDVEHVALERCATSVTRSHAVTSSPPNPEQDPQRYRRAAVRWLARLLVEREIELEDAALAAAALGALSHRGAREAAQLLMELARRPRPERPLAITSRTP